MLRNKLLVMQLCKYRMEEEQPLLASSTEEKRNDFIAGRTLDWEERAELMEYAWETLRRFRTKMVWPMATTSALEITHTSFCGDGPVISPRDLSDRVQEC